jgi:DNA-binding NtrC family response regulator
VADVLGFWGVEGTFASTISEARKILLEQPIGLVFCESHLPDGGLFTDLLDAATSKTFPLRLVAILHDVNEYANAIQLGAFEAIVAPCQRSDIQWVIIQATHAEQESPPDLEGLGNREDSAYEAGSSLPSRITRELYGSRRR